MDIARQIQHILAQANPSRIRSAVLRGDPGIPVRWMTIVELEKTGVQFGIAETGYWVIATGDGIVEFIPGTKLVLLLPCLEMPAPAFFAHLSRAVAARDLPAALVRTFPTDSLMMTALQHTASSYWMSLALDWIAESTHISDEISVLLEELGIAGNHIPQPIRHRARRLSKIAVR